MKTKSVLDNQIFPTLTKSVTIGTRLCTNTIILPKLNPIEDSQPKQETKSNMSSSTDNVKVKEEPIESEEEQQQNDVSSSSSIKSESSGTNTNGVKFKETQKAHRKFA